jgi:hypothetical protein
MGNRKKTWECSQEGIKERKSTCNLWMEGVTAASRPKINALSYSIAYYTLSTLNLDMGDLHATPDSLQTNMWGCGEGLHDE